MDRILNIIAESQLLKQFLNPIYLNLKTLQKLKTTFTKAKPFQHLQLQNFLKEEIILGLTSNLLQEPFFTKDSDLFSFLQTNDLKGAHHQSITDFRNFLQSKDFLTFFEYLTTSKLTTKKLDLFGSIYQNTHYLLPHDDRLDSRNIAFILYLSTLQKKEGGALALYDSKTTSGKVVPTKKHLALQPQANTFTFFKVSQKSYHEVEEVLTQKQRISFTGWFHHA